MSAGDNFEKQFQDRCKHGTISDTYECSGATVCVCILERETERMYVRVRVCVCVCVCVSSIKCVRVFQCGEVIYTYIHVCIGAQVCEPNMCIWPPPHTLPTKFVHVSYFQQALS